jgi:5'-methylthioadenosine phosphorylase
MKIGIIGGSGLEKSDIFSNLEEIKVETPYGETSSKIKKGNLNGVEIFIISRHGENHEIMPTHVNNKANIYALAKLGVKQILATTAVGSLKEKIAPGNFLIANQFIDFTKHREITFYKNFKEGIKHTSMAEPFSEFLRQKLIDACEELDLTNHKIGTILTIEGPRFSTRAESFMFRNFAHVVNMSTAPEAILANEAGIEYAVIAMATDYDCWKKSEDPVTWEMIEEQMKKNSENVKKILIKTIEKISNKETSSRDTEIIRESITDIPNWPKQGIIFRDITSLMQNKEAMKKTIEILVNRYKNKQIDVIAGIESRGFIFGAILAERLGVDFVPIRKKGKLPRDKISQEYELEYGTDTVEIHSDAIKPGQKVLVIDDLIATGGTALAGCQLIEKLQGQIIEVAFVIELPDLRGREKLARYKIYSIVKFEGE